MKKKSKQQQFSTAIKRFKIENILNLLNDPEVIPSYNDNWAISYLLNNKPLTYKEFLNFISFEKFNPLHKDYYSKHLKESINYSDKDFIDIDNRIFMYLFNNNKYNITIDFKSLCIKAAKNRNTKLLSFLLKHSDNKNIHSYIEELLTESIIANNESTIELIINHPTKINYFSNNGLLLAIEYDLTFVIEKIYKSNKIKVTEKELIEVIKNANLSSFILFLNDENFLFNDLKFCIIELLWKSIINDFKQNNDIYYSDMIKFLIESDKINLLMLNKIKYDFISIYALFKDKVDLKISKIKIMENIRSF
jgi:hypothetical protein